MLSAAFHILFFHVLCPSHLSAIRAAVATLCTPRPSLVLSYVLRQTIVTSVAHPCSLWPLLMLAWADAAASQASLQWPGPATKEQECTLRDTTEVPAVRLLLCGAPAQLNGQSH